jgi:hypothetical protein
MLWLLVTLLVCVAIHLAVSHICYDIIQGFISGYVGILIRKNLGGCWLVY